MMDLQNLIESLPNGFHDSKISSININYLEHVLSIQIEVWIGNETDREKYRSATLILENFEFIMMESPDESYPYSDRKMLDVDIGLTSADKKSPMIPKLPESSKLYWIYVRNWNSFIHVACRNANIEWH